MENRVSQPVAGAMTEKLPVINRCSCTNKAQIDSMPPFPKRITRCYELEYITWGSGYVMMEGKKLDTVAGVVLARLPGVEVQGFLPYTSYCILLDELPAEELPEFCAFPPAHPIQSLFQDVYNSYLSNDPNKSLRMAAGVLNILYHVMSASKYEKMTKKPASAQYHINKLQRLSAYIEKNLDKRMSLNELASICNVSAGFLCRIFQEANGVSLFTYINAYRVQRACSLLIETNLPIKDVCAKCGFENESYFYRTFKHSVHLSPAAYRRLHRQPYEQ